MPRADPALAVGRRAVPALKELVLLQVLACFVAGWMLAQWRPSRQDDRPPPAAHRPDRSAAVDGAAREAIGSDDLDERSLVHAAARRMEMSPGDKVALKYAAWAERDPRGAIAAAFRHEPEAERSRAIDAAVLTVAEDNAALALEISLPIMAAIGAGEPLQGFSLMGAVETIFQQYARQNFSAAAGAVAALPEFMFGGEGTGASSFGGGFSGQLLRPKLALVAAVAVAARWPDDDLPRKIRWAGELFIDDSDDWDEFFSLVDPPGEDAGWDSRHPGTSAAILAEVSQISVPLVRDLALLLTIGCADESVGRLAVAGMSEVMRGAGWAALSARVDDPLDGFAIIADHWDEIAATGDGSFASSPIEALDNLGRSDDPFGRQRFPGPQLLPRDRFLQLPEIGQDHLLDSLLEFYGAGGLSYIGDPFALTQESGVGDDPSRELINFVEALPTGGVQERAAARLATDWVRSNPQHASEWIATIPAGAGYRDAAVSALVQTIAPEDPQGATIWAGSITDPTLRERFLRVALRHWSATDPASAGVAIRQAELSDAATRALLEPVITTDE